MGDLGWSRARALPWHSAERTRALPGGLCRHGHPSAGTELLESGLPGWQGVPTAHGGPGSTFHHPEMPPSSSASWAELGTCLFAEQPA